MEKLKRLKPYKDTSPAETIHRIRQILFDNDLFVIESAQKTDPVSGVCSCRVILGDEGLRDLNIGTNGKGMTARYALASAYAEFMERLQNGALLWKAEGMPGFMPGAIRVEREELARLAKQLLDMAYGSSEATEKAAQQYAQNCADPMAAPFQEYQSGKTVWLPVSLLNKMTGSNGMAAGNTVLEATIQGLSEIFERAAIETLFLQPLTPPVIDETWFCDTEVLQRLHLLAQKGLTYRILDCSLGTGLPVIGLLLEKGQTYHIHFGADPSPITALERCLTEVFQGRTLETLPLYPPLPETADRQLLFENEKREYTDSTGAVPTWLIRGEPSWSFTGFAHPVTVSAEDDLPYYLQIRDRMGKPLYLCQTGVLGFPTVRLYVPGINEIHCPSPESCQESRVPDHIKRLLCNLPSLQDEEFRTLAQSLEAWLRQHHRILAAKDFFSGSVPELKEAFPAGTFAPRRWDTRLLVAAIYLRGGLSEQGTALLEHYIAETQLPPKEAEMLKVRLRSRTLTFLPTQWPQCPDCSACRAKPHCRKTAIDNLRTALSAQLLR